MTNASRDTSSGLRFEDATKIVRDGKDISKTEFVKYIKEHGGTPTDWTRYPDAAFIWEDDKEIVIYEKKFQEKDGSADEKPAIGPFLLSQYRKMAATIGIRPEKVTLIYIFSDYFKAPKYKDMLDYIEENGCKYTFWSDEEKREEMLNYRAPKSTIKNLISKLFH